MEDNLVDIENRDVGPGGKVTGLFFGFILLIISIWGVVINPMTNTINSLQDRVITLEEAQKTIREDAKRVDGINQQAERNYDVIKTLDDLLHKNELQDAIWHSTLDQRLKVLEESHKK